MRAHRKPIFTLLLVTPVLTELLSGNLAPSAFLNPIVPLFLSTVGYGFPILLLREFSIRKRMGIPGLAYGIFNEGILAMTFYMAVKVPINTFDGYGRVFGISVPWAVTISTWHALHAFLYPVALVYYLFPEHCDATWLTRKNRNWISGITITVATLVFFTHSKETAASNPAHFIIMLGSMALLIWAGAKLPSTAVLGRQGLFKTKTILMGALGFLGLFLVPVIMAAMKIPPVLFHGYYILAFAWIIRRLRQIRAVPVTTLLLFALGDDIMVALFGAIGTIGQGSIQKLIAELFFLGAFTWLIVRLRKQSAQRHPAEETRTQ